MSSIEPVDSKTTENEVKSDVSTPPSPRDNIPSPTPLLDAEPLIIPEPPVSYAEKKDKDEPNVADVPEINIPKIPVGEKDPVENDENLKDPVENDENPITLSECNELYEKMETAKKNFKDSMKRYMEKQHLEKDLLKRYALELENENRRSSSVTSVTLVPSVSLSNSSYLSSSYALTPSVSYSLSYGYPTHGYINW
jgi:hypothetical protein